MSHKTMIIARGSQTLRVRVCADAPRPIAKWLRSCAKAAIQQRANLFAMRHGGAWKVHHCYGPSSAPRWSDPIKAFPNEDAAAMWLLHKELQNG